MPTLNLPTLAQTSATYIACPYNPGCQSVWFDRLCQLFGYASFDTIPDNMFTSSHSAPFDECTIPTPTFIQNM